MPQIQLPATTLIQNNLKDYLFIFCSMSRQKFHESIHMPLSTYTLKFRIELSASRNSESVISINIVIIIMIWEKTPRKKNAIKKNDKCQAKKNMV